MSTRAPRLVITALMLSTGIASAQPGATEPSGDDIQTQVNEIDEQEARDAEARRQADTEVLAPSMVRAEYQPSTSTSLRKRETSSLIATTEPWGAGVRFTGLSGVGALPGVNYGAEVSGYVRHQELFGELAFGWWRPEDHITVREGTEYTDLKLKLWTLRGGWAAMHVPLRAWALVEAGEVAGAKGMPGVMARMVTGDMPVANRWQAVGAGMGIAWPMAQNARLFGMVELAVPVNRGTLMTDTGEYKPDAMAARSSVGLELGWR